MTRVLLTGAAGFIGGHILDAARDTDFEMVAVDAMLGSAHGPGATAEGITDLDVRDKDSLVEALRGVDVVCHQAAVVGAGVDAADAPAYASHNDFGTAVLLAAMYEAGCSRLVLALSMVVYGDGTYTDAVGAAAVQVFVGNPRGWKLTSGDPAQDADWDALVAGRVRGVLDYF